VFLLALSVVKLRRVQNTGSSVDEKLCDVKDRLLARNSGKIGLHVSYLLCILEHGITFVQDLVKQFHSNRSSFFVLFR
jgi:hypothetical protein